MSDIKVTPPDPARPATDAAARLPRRTSVSRHGAISRELTKYSNYKTWAETDAEVPGPNGASHSRRSADR